jgi:hypothetical protein
MGRAGGQKMTLNRVSGRSKARGGAGVVRSAAQDRTGGHKRPAQGRAGRAGAKILCDRCLRLRHLRFCREQNRESSLTFVFSVTGLRFKAGACYCLIKRRGNGVGFDRG